tara:strand:- start:10 stop:324 length:315 start_codon:yes stop_codon:yes gene_type:complete
MITRKFGKREFKARLQCGVNFAYEARPHLLLSEFFPVEVLQLVGVWGNTPNDTISFSSMERCARRLGEIYPPEVLAEMVIDDFYADVCRDCLEHDNCHTTAYRL